ncbi:hypothetical protein [Neobacillus sp. SAB-20_R2A]
MAKKNTPNSIPYSIWDTKLDNDQIEMNEKIAETMKGSTAEQKSTEQQD